MKFAIFTSFYNYLDGFDDLVESIFSQTYTNWEWIISDDFSENSDVIEKLKQLSDNNPKIKLILPTFKKEFYWNPPTTETDADIFLVQDSDDIMHPKLLEVYKHNFDKFSNVQMISTNSVLRWNTVKGNVHSTRLINYKDTCNFYDRLKNREFGVYNIGDCRAWRNNIIKFDEPNKWMLCAEDTLKTLVNEEKGNILYLPRVLHTYSHREDSISKKKTYDLTLLDEYRYMMEDANDRVDREDLNSIEVYYDDIYKHTTPFYFSNLNFEKNSKIVEYFHPRVNPRIKERLKSLYFDHDLRFVETPRADYLFIKIEEEKDLSFLSERIKKFIPKIEFRIDCPEDLLGNVSQILLENGYPYNWFAFGTVSVNVVIKNEWYLYLSTNLW